jgi:hypothetical protein
MLKNISCMANGKWKMVKRQSLAVLSHLPSTIFHQAGILQRPAKPMLKAEG